MNAHVHKFEQDYLPSICLPVSSRRREVKLATAEQSADAAPSAVAITPPKKRGEFLPPHAKCRRDMTIERPQSIGQLFNPPDQQHSGKQP
jgi:hypothetical protein